MAVAGLLIPNDCDLYCKSITAGNIIGPITPTTLNIEQKSGASVPSPAPGFQTLFANSDQNDNAELKLSDGSLLSISSELSQFIVDGNPDHKMKYTTIQAALDDAKVLGGQQNVIVRAGTYTENLTMFADINIICVSNQNLTIGEVNSAVKIMGTITCNYNGLASISNALIIGENVDVVTSTSGSNAITFNNCDIRCLTTGTCFNINNGNCTVYFYNGQIDGDTTNLMTLTDVASFFCYNSQVGLTGGSILNLTPEHFPAVFRNCFLGCRVIINNAGQGIFMYNFFIVGDVPVFTVNNGGTVSAVSNTISSDPSSSTDFIVGTGSGGTMNNAVNVLAGRSTVGAGVTVNMVTVF